MPASQASSTPIANRWASDTRGSGFRGAGAAGASIDAWTPPAGGGGRMPAGPAGDTMRRMSSSEHPERPEHDAAVQEPSHAVAVTGPDPAAAPRELHVNWIYGLFAVVLLALGFGVWGAWMVFGGEPGEDPLVLQQRVEGLQQRVTTLSRSDQISREAN